MDWLTKWLFSSETKLAQLAEQLAVRCQDTVWRRVSQQALAMSPAEARGYVRALCARTVQHQVAGAVSGRRDLASSQSRLAELTTEQVIRLVSVQLRAVRPARPAQQAGRRAA